jgi:hypothetical protein
MLWRSTLALAGVSTALLLASQDLRAGGGQPLYQMPVPCGQKWDASTYADHWTAPDDPAGVNAIDLAQRDGTGTNMSEGEPALAAAAGSVKKVFTTSGGEHRVYLDHGNGHETHYIHLESLAPQLTVGKQVAQGEQIGRVSNSGAEAMHLHYNQIENGGAVRVSFNGNPIDTHAENEDSWGTWGSDDAEELTSLNCADDEFVQFNQNGMRYVLLYKPSTGLVKVQRVDPDGTGTTNVYGGYWKQRITHLVPFTLSGGQQHLFTYQSSTGEVQFHRINGQGEGTTVLSTGQWGKGWTKFAPFTLGGKPYFIAYNSLYGYANIDKVNAEGSGSTKIYGSTWTTGWTHLEPFIVGGKPYVLLYKAGTGEVEVNKLTGSGNNVALTEVWSSLWTTGWSHLVPIKHNGSVILLAYRASTGSVNYSKFKGNGQGTSYLGAATWTKTWTAFTPLLLDDGAVLIYKGGSGAVQIRSLNAAGGSSSALWSGSWTTGWS